MEDITLSSSEDGERDPDNQIRLSGRVCSRLLEMMFYKIGSRPPWTERTYDFYYPIKPGWVFHFCCRKVMKFFIASHALAALPTAFLFSPFLYLDCLLDFGIMQGYRGLSLSNGVIKICSAPYLFSTC